jgi:hypothetical protein
VPDNDPVNHLLTSDDVLPAEGVQALVDSLDNTVDVLDNQHDTGGGLSFVHGGAPQCLIGVAGIRLNDGLLDMESEPTPFWGTSWGPNIRSVQIENPMDGLGPAIWVEIARGLPRAAMAFTRTSMDPTTGVGASQTDKWDAIVPTCQIWKQGFQVGLKYVRVRFPYLGANFQYAGEIETVLVLVHGTPG